MCSTLDCINSVDELTVSFTGNNMVSLWAVEASASTLGSTYSSDDNSDTSTTDPAISV